MLVCAGAGACLTAMAMTRSLPIEGSTRQCGPMFAVRPSRSARDQRPGVSEDLAEGVEGQLPEVHSAAARSDGEA